MSKGLLKLLLLSATVATYLLVIKPLYSGVGSVFVPEQSIKSLQLLNQQYDGTLAKADELVNQAQELRKQYEKISAEDKAKMEIMVPSSIDKVRLLSEVQGIADQSGFALTNLTFGEGVGMSTNRGVATISFSVKTTYPRFKEFMNNFEKSLRLFSIDSVSFNAPEDGDLTNYQVKLQTYYLK